VSSFRAWTCRLALVGVALITVAAGSTPAVEAAGHKATVAPIVIKVNNDVPANALKGESWRVFAQYAHRYLGNRVKIEIYDSGSLYKQNDQISALEQNEVQFIAPGSDLFASVLPSFVLWGLPYLWKSPAMLEAALKDPQIGGVLLKQMAAKNMEAVGFWLNGWRDVGAKHPILTLQDMKGLKIRVPAGQNYVAAMQALGADVTPLDYTQVPEALQQGIIDAVEVTPNNWYSDKLYQLAPDITFTDYIYSTYIVATNKQWWDHLPKAIRDGLEKALAQAQAWNWRETSRVNEQDIRLMQDAGAHFYWLSPNEFQTWVKTVSPVWNQFASVVGPNVLRAAIALHNKYSWDLSN
jgi:tripartite ATP-independent transporter DctP family solute receptor